MLVADMVDEFDLSFLGDAASLVDSRLRALELDAKRSEDPDEHGIFDMAEYLTGFGLVACQTYISARVARSRRKKKDALELGPPHACGQSMVSLVYALANYWKHGPEWETPPSKQAQETIDTIAKLGLDLHDSYLATNALSALLRPNEPRIGRVIPFLKQWSEVLRNAA